MILGKITMAVLGICPNAKLPRLTRGQLGRPSGAYQCHASRRTSVIFSTEDLEATRRLGLERRFPRMVGTQDHVESRDEKKKGGEWPLRRIAGAENMLIGNKSGGIKDGR